MYGIRTCYLLSYNKALFGIMSNKSDEFYVRGIQDVQIYLY